MSGNRLDLLYESPASGDSIPSPSYTFYSDWLNSDDLESVLVAVTVTDSTMGVGIEESIDPSASYPVRQTPVTVSQCPAIGRTGGDFQASGEVALIGRYFRLVVSISSPGSNLGFWATLRGKFS